MKKITLVVVIFIGFCIVFLTSQRSSQTQMQVTNFIVIRMDRVRARAPDNSQRRGQLEARKQAFETEVQQLAAEIYELQERRAEAVTQQNSNEIWRLDAEIGSKSEHYRNFLNEQVTELAAEEEEVEKIYMNRVSNAAQSVAISEGASMVIDIDAPGVIWFSGSINKTDEVVQAMGGR